MRKVRVNRRKHASVLVTMMVKGDVMRRAVCAIGALLLVAGCSPGATKTGTSAARAVSPYLDDLLIGAGASSDEVGRALTLGSEELTALRTVPGATDEVIRSTASQLDRETTLLSRVERALGPAVDEAPAIVSKACDIVDGYASQPETDEVAAVVGELQQAETLADHIAWLTLCNGMRAVDAAGEL